MNSPMQQVVKPRGIPLLSRHETVLALLIVLLSALSIYLAQERRKRE